MSKTRNSFLTLILISSGKDSKFDLNKFKLNNFHYSTQNPFLALFEKGDLLAHVDKMFTLHYDLNEQLSYLEFVELAKKRGERLHQLESLFTHLENHPNLENFNEGKTKLLENFFNFFFKISQMSLKTKWRK